MVKKWSILVLMVMVALGIQIVAAQDVTGARVRLAHLAFDVENVDLHVDGTLTLQDTSFFDITDNVYLPAGTHTFTITLTDRQIDRALTTPVSVNLVSGYSYIIALVGQQADASLKTIAIDETTAFTVAELDPTGEQDIILNAVGNAPGVDVYFGDTWVINDLKYGEYQAVNFPQRSTPFRFLEAGNRQNKVIFDVGDSYGLANNTSLIALVGNYSDNGQPRLGAFVSNYSPLKIPDYLDGYSSHPQINFNTFTQLLKTTKQVNTLNGIGPFTVFVPSDSVFDNLPSGTVDKLIASPKALSRVLSYHIVQGRLTRTELQKRADASGEIELNTLLGTKMMISLNDFTINNTVTITSVDFGAGNGVIHLIDGVLQLTGGPAAGPSVYLPGLPAQLS